MKTMRTKMESEHNDMFNFVMQDLSGISATVDHVVQALQMMSQKPYKCRVSIQTHTCETSPV